MTISVPSKKEVHLKVFFNGKLLSKINNYFLPINIEMLCGFWLYFTRDIGFNFIIDIYL